jgi:hypothetical protein
MVYTTYSANLEGGGKAGNVNSRKCKGQKKKTKGTRNRKEKGDRETGMSVLRGGKQKGGGGMKKRRRDLDVHVWGGARGRTERTPRNHKKTSARTRTHAHSYNMWSTSATR